MYLGPPCRYIGDSHIQNMNQNLAALYFSLDFEFKQITFSVYAAAEMCPYFQCRQLGVNEGSYS